MVENGAQNDGKLEISDKVYRSIHRSKTKYIGRAESQFMLRMVKGAALVKKAKKCTMGFSKFICMMEIVPKNKLQDFINSEQLDLQDKVVRNMV